MASRRRPGASCDLEELRPNLFVVHNPAAGPVLRGEGDREGDRFRLTTWRRDGLLARLQMRGFVVHSLIDQVAALPALPHSAPPGPAVLFLPAGRDRVSYFAGAPPGWQPLEPDLANSQQYALREGWLIRRRRGRGPASYAQVRAGRLSGLDEDHALYAGYAQAALAGVTLLPATAHGDGYLLPDLPLPRAYSDLLGRIAEHTKAGWLVSPAGLESACALFARLGIELEIPDA